MIAVPCGNRLSLQGIHPGISNAKDRDFCEVHEMQWWPLYFFPGCGGLHSDSQFQDEGCMLHCGIRHGSGNRQAISINLYSVGLSSNFIR